MIFRTVASIALIAACEAMLLRWLRREPSSGRAAAIIGGSVAFALGSTAILSIDAFDFARLMGWALFLNGPLLLLGIARIDWSTRRRASVIALCFAVFLDLVAAYAYVIEPRWLEVTHTEISSPNLTRRVRIALIADIQTDHVGAYERRAMRTLMRQKPDVIVFAGDYIQAHPTRTGTQERALRDLLLDEKVSAPLGVIVVRGNVDRPTWLSSFEGTGFVASPITGTVTNGPISVTGLSELDSFNPALKIARSPGFHIVAGHSPDFALGSIDGDLLVAGHTHGGQVRLPLFGPIVNNSRVSRSWAAGHTALSGGRSLVISRGVGMERANAPRLRFLCRPELTIIDAVPA